MFQYLKNELWDGIPGKSIQTIPYTFSSSSQAWLPHNPSPAPPTNTRLDPITVLSWNIDAGAPFPAERMSSILTHLQALEPKLDLIQFQEVHPLALQQILSTGWAQQQFATTTLVLPSYSKKYGTVTLISKRRLGAVTRIFRMPFDMSVMGRDALVVDMAVEEGGKSGVVRFVNVHIESLMGYGVKARESQMAECSALMKGRGVVGGVVAGDVNAIAVEDVGMPGRFGFVDVWEVMKEKQRKLDDEGSLPGNENKGGVTGQQAGRPGCGVDEGKTTDTRVGGASKPEEESGFTWGFQPPGPFPPGRLDKVLATGVISGELTTFGKDLQLSKEEIDHTNEIEMKDSGPNTKELWLSDHYALLANIRLNLSHRF